MEEKKQLEEEIEQIKERLAQHEKTLIVASSATIFFSIAVCADLIVTMLNIL